MADAYTESLIDAAIDEIGLEVQAPSSPFYYGRDLSCVYDCDEQLTEVDPQSSDAIVEALIRRLITSRGSLVDDENYGLDIRSYLSKGMTPRQLQQVQDDVRVECLKDERVEDISVTVTTANTSAGLTMTLSLSVTPADPEIKAFNFVFAVTDKGVLTKAIGVSSNG